MKSLSIALLGILLAVSTQAAELNGGYSKPLARRFKALR
jgi:hypothetical protein